MFPAYSFFPLFLLWFGAAVSLPEIQTGALLAPAGLKSGLAAILLGHVAGCALLGLLAYASRKEQLPAMMCSRLSFGRKGSWLFSLLNALQLLGWTAVMLQQSSLAANAILGELFNVNAPHLLSVFMGLAVLIWSLGEAGNRHKGNILAVCLLFILTLLLSIQLWPLLSSFLPDSALAATSAPEASKASSMSFGLAFELSIIMPLSWAPLIGDYACRAKTIFTAVAAPVGGYFLGSVWMYLIGFGAALGTGELEPAAMLLALGLGLIALGVVCLSAVTTTFLDVYSAAISVRNVSSELCPKLSAKVVCGLVTGLGTLLALVWNSEIYVSFLLLIGTFFAPFIGILLCDYFLLRNNSRHEGFDKISLLSLLCGVLFYWVAAGQELPLGNTLFCVLLTAGVHFGLRKLGGRLFSS